MLTFCFFAFCAPGRHSGRRNRMAQHAVISIRVSMIFPEIMLLFALLQVFCLPEKGDAAAEKAPAKHGKKAKPDVPADHPGLARQWLPPILAAVVMMVVCGAASRVIFGFLY